MASLDQVVDIVISRATLTVTRAGFGIPLLMGDASGILAAGEVGQYASLAEVVADGFLTSSTVYKMANAIFAQSPRPEHVLVAPTSTPVAQVVTFTPDVSIQSIQAFIVVLNGTTYSFTSDATPTAAEVVTGLIALVNGDSGAVVTASGTTTLIITADVAGDAFSYSGTLMTAVLTTPSNGIADDIADALQENPNFYGIVLEDRTENDIMTAAAYVETIKRLLFVCNEEADVLNGTVGSTLDRLEALNYDRTVYLYSGSQETYPEAAWMGNTFPIDPGGVNFAFRNLAGQVSDNLTSTQQSAIQDLNGNTYQEIGGVDVTAPGKVVSGEWIDVIRDVDWLEARLKEDIYSLLVNNDKVPFTDAGGTLLGNTIQKRLEEAVRNGILASYTLTVPKVADIPTDDRTARYFTGIEFEGILQGAINKVKIRGTVSV